MKKKYNAPLAEVLELEIDETICANTTSDTVNGTEKGDNDDPYTELL